jgi:hypothetical protein
MEILIHYLIAIKRNNIGETFVSIRKHYVNAGIDVILT